MKLPIYLVITGYFPTPKSWRGAFVLDQVKAIQRTGRYRVVVVMTKSTEDYRYDGFEVIAFKAFCRGFALCPVVYDWVNIKRLLSLLNRKGIPLNDIAVVHAHVVPGAFYPYLFKKKFPQIVSVVQFHDLDPMGSRNGVGWGMFQWLKRFVVYRHYRSIVEKLDVCLAISNLVAKVVKEFPHLTMSPTYPGMKEALYGLRFCRSARNPQLFVLHNGVDVRVFNRQERRRFSRNHLGCVANFIPLKDQITLIKAVEILIRRGIEVTVTFVGSGPCLKSCQEYVRQHHLGTAVEFLPEVRHEQLPTFYHQIDVFVLPSYSEGLGCVFLEAWCCGTPFVGCEGQGIEDYIRPEERSLWLFPPRNADALADRIENILKHRPVQELAAKWDIDELIPDYLSWLEHSKR